MSSTCTLLVLGHSWLQKHNPQIDWLAKNSQLVFLLPIFLPAIGSSSCCSYPVPGSFFSPWPLGHALNTMTWERSSVRSTCLTGLMTALWNRSLGPPCHNAGCITCPVLRERDHGETHINARIIPSSSSPQLLFHGQEKKKPSVLVSITRARITSPWRTNTPCLSSTPPACSTPFHTAPWWGLLNTPVPHLHSNQQCI